MFYSKLKRTNIFNFYSKYSLTFQLSTILNNIFHTSIKNKHYSLYDRMSNRGKGTTQTQLGSNTEPEIFKITNPQTVNWNRWDIFMNYFQPAVPSILVWATGRLRHRLSICIPRFHNRVLFKYCLVQTTFFTSTYWYRMLVVIQIYNWFIKI